ncbi:aldo/keto reductase (plasmid) [Ensifer adhaerens]|uniref:aldo/keto reductase n=1 Tax=Ensifer adhaerens TaxID=106592 RepID=UPI001CBE0B6C|nr:aldo/keto reductase [Ensifer adhaerens]MBZ7927429.1 aldo/keto reductase [Ensifer adhaerens]UAX97860.1 aldo/keto reductase [Ensifer adhaerens]UAY05239.1 aldo/keto reductase [Ensifer adhaerens]UAY12617.1 aldo/keto reductase [Ensifer adhaerens]
MQYIRLGQSGLKVSRLCLGTMNMGSKNWKPWIFDESESEPIIAHALDNGVNFIDLADFYSAGAGEEVVCNVLRRVARREELIITTKLGYAIGKGVNSGGHSRKRVFDAMDGSLTRMKSDYVDIYMLHYFDTETPVEETMEAMNDLVRAGKARYIGVSTMFTWQFAKILKVCEKNGWARPINMQLQLNCAYREEEREMIPFCADQGVGVSVFSPLARGILTNDMNSIRNQTDFFTAEMYNDRASRDIALSVARVAEARGVSPAQIAQAWVLGKPEISSMLVGADTKAQFDSALAALSTALDADEVFEIERNYTPCDLINDYTAGKRLPREPRPAAGRFAAPMAAVA